MTTIYEHFFNDTPEPSGGWRDQEHDNRIQQQHAQRELELQQQKELEDERQENRIRAVRKCLTSGTPMDTIYYLCEELGIKYEQVVS